MRKRIASARWHTHPSPHYTGTHSSFPPYLPSYTPNHYDSDCSSRRLPPRQRWPRFHQIIQMTSSSVCVYEQVHACLYFVSVVSIALFTVCAFVYFPKRHHIQKKKVFWTIQTFSIRRHHTTHMQIGFRDTARVCVNTGSTSVVLRATELQQPYMLICISSDKTHLEKSIQALWHAKNNPTVPQHTEVSWLGLTSATLRDLPPLLWPSTYHGKQYSVRMYYYFLVGCGHIHMEYRSDSSGAVGYGTLNQGQLCLTTALFE